MSEVINILRGSENYIGVKLRIFVSDVNNPTYCYFSDGVNIGYAQWDRSRKLATVHKPTVGIGDGFAWDVFGLSLENMVEAMKMRAPDWATQRDRNAVVKYKDISEFLREYKGVKLYEV